MLIGARYVSPVKDIPAGIGYAAQDLRSRTMHMGQPFQQVRGSNVALQVIDPSPAEVIVEGPFRVGIELAHSGLPSVASDTDGRITGDANFIPASAPPFGFLWFRSYDLGVSGDWIIRATISRAFPEPAVPALSVPGRPALAALSPVLGAALLRRRRPPVRRD